MKIKTFKTNPISLFLDENDKEEKKDVPIDVQLLRVGEFSYFEPGDMEINEGVLQSFVNNFESNVRGIDLAIDYSHMNHLEAAGWIKKLYLSDDKTALMAKVDWTNKGKEKLKEKEYRYLSAEFSFSYTDNENKKDFGPTLYGAGLTNRPFVKQMEPLSELQENNKNNLEGDRMKLEERLAALEEKHKESEKKLSESTQTIMELKAENKKLSEEKEQMKVDQEKKEKETKFNVMLGEGKVCEAQRQAYMDGNVEKFSELAQPINLKKDENRELKDKENKKPEVMTCEEAEDKVLELSRAHMKENKVSWRESVTKVLSENPELAKRYQDKIDREIA